MSVIRVAGLKWLSLATIVSVIVVVMPE